MKSLHYNNHITSKQKFDDVAIELLSQIIECGQKQILLSVDDGDGSIWKYTIEVDCKIVKQASQLNEN